VYVPLQGSNRRTELRIRQGFPDPDGIFESFAGDRLKPQPIKEYLPEEEIFHQVHPGRQADGRSDFRCGLLIKAESFPALSQEIECPDADADEMPGVIVPAA